MNGKQAEEVTGITKRNLRFYEDQGLIEPSRNPENDYRDYSDKDIEILKIIRGLRTLDVPLDIIKEYLHKKITLQELAALQEQRLTEKQKEVETAIKFCKELQNVSELNSKNIDSLLVKLDEPKNKKNLFTDWLDDYKIINEKEEIRTFYIYLDKQPETIQDVIIELCNYAEKNNIKIDIVKYSWQPEFMMNGILYKAYPPPIYYTPVPIEFIYCEAVNENDIYTKPLTKRQKVIKFLRKWSIVIIVAVGSLVIDMAYNGGLKCVLQPRFWLMTLLILSLVLLANIWNYYQEGRNRIFNKKNDK